MERLTRGLSNGHRSLLAGDAVSRAHADFDALDIWVKKLRAAGHSAIETSWAQRHGSPEPFYLKAGFVLTGEMDDDEHVARHSI